MLESLIFATLNKTIIFEKESLANAKKLSNFIQTDTNEKKIVKSLATFHTAVKIFLNPFMTEAVFV